MPWMTKKHTAQHSYKLSIFLPGNYFKILQSYLHNKSFTVQYNKALSTTLMIGVKAPQDSILNFLLHLLYDADIPEIVASIATEIAIFADDTVLVP